MKKSGIASHMTRCARIDIPSFSTGCASFFSRTKSYMIALSSDLSYRSRFSRFRTRIFMLLVFSERSTISFDVTLPQKKHVCVSLLAFFTIRLSFLLVSRSLLLRTGASRLSTLILFTVAIAHALILPTLRLTPSHFCPR